MKELVAGLAIAAALWSAACAPKPAARRLPTGPGCRPHSGNVAHLAVFPSRALNGGATPLGFVYAAPKDSTKRQRALRILEDGTWILSEQESGGFVADLARGTWSTSTGVTGLPPDVFDGSGHVWSHGDLRAEVDGRRVAESYVDCFE